MTSYVKNLKMIAICIDFFSVPEFLEAGEFWDHDLSASSC